MNQPPTLITTHNLTPPRQRRMLAHSRSDSRVSEIQSLGSLTRLTGLRIMEVAESEDGGESVDSHHSLFSPEELKKASEDPQSSPKTLLGALDKLHNTHLDGVDILYVSISKELQSIKNMVIANNKQSTIRQIVGLCMTILISLIFNIFVFPHFNSKCKS